MDKQKDGWLSKVLRYVGKQRAGCLRKDGNIGNERERMSFVDARARKVYRTPDGDYNEEVRR